uniref:Uncharacterized protein n=1 Tax=Molossus molossus TaxID=27622 RepID=A0A7J8DQJ6_MOLMO|nr:hypothetical protein HJG59_009309 [Molossus molossus]
MSVPKHHPRTCGNTLCSVTASTPASHPGLQIEREGERGRERERHRREGTHRVAATFTTKPGPGTNCNRDDNSSPTFIHTSTINNAGKIRISDEDEGNNSTQKRPQVLMMRTVDMSQIQDAGVEQRSKQNNHVAGTTHTGQLLKFQ